MSPRALVRGGGPAGLTCARLLVAHGWRVDISSRPRRPEAAVVLNEVAVELLRQLWGIEAGSIKGAQPLMRRIAHWQARSPGSVMAQAGLCLPLNSLASVMSRQAEQAGLNGVDDGMVDLSAYDWIIDARGRHGAPERLAFGRRRTLAARVRLKRVAPRDASRIEAVPGGWLFLAPLGGPDGVLQAMSAVPVDVPADRLRVLLEASRQLREGVDALVSDVVSLEGMPSLSLEAAGSDRIAVGDAALALDPLSGDGVGCGLRSAILAVAVIEAIQEGHDARACLHHYQRRLRLAARAHVQVCIEHYASARHAACWRGEIEAMRVALAQCDAGHGPFAFGLRARPPSPGTPLPRPQLADC